MRLLKLLLFILFLNMPLAMFAQDDLSEILKAYPDWQTNFDKKTIDTW